MTGKPFEPPAPDWNILKRLSWLAAAGHHESDGRSIRSGEPFPAQRIPSPVAAIIVADPCPDTAEAEKRELDRSLSRKEDFE